MLFIGPNEAKLYVLGPLQCEGQKWNNFFIFVFTMDFKAKVMLSFHNSFEPDLLNFFGKLQPIQLPHLCDWLFAAYPAYQRAL